MTLNYPIVMMDGPLPAATTLADEEVQKFSEMWDWYQPNSEKLMSMLATFDQVNI